MFCPCISNHVLQSKKGEREPKTEDTQNHGSTTCSSGMYLHFKVTASQLTL